VAAAAAALAMAAMLRFFPPAVFRFYPVCLFRQWTGYACPGCGMTHALAALLAGRIAQARDNPLALLVAPGAVALAVWQGYAALRWNHWRPLPAAPRTAVVLASAAVLFGILRNFAPQLLGPR
jgi:hypothetical protein